MKHLSSIIFVFIFVSLFTFCNKDGDKKEIPPNHNQINATIKLSSGNTIVINEKGNWVKFGCLKSGGFYIDAENKSNHGIIMETINGCYPPTGTYTQIKCTYAPYAHTNLGLVYKNDNFENCSITIDSMNFEFCEGSFTGIATLALETGGFDTATITGSFKGNTFELLK